MTDVIGYWFAARQQALKVVHLWDAPPVMRQYLETGDESIRAAAKDAAYDEAYDAARAPAWDAAMTATWDAAWDAARRATWAAARAAAFAADRDAAWSAAMGAARAEFLAMVEEAF